MNTANISKIPAYVKEVIETLERNNFEAYLVGGCVRDMILGREPKDWDVTTNATPEEIIPLFTKTVYENTFGTVAVVFEDFPSPVSDIRYLPTRQVGPNPIVEVTPYRIETTYTDNRHPDTVVFSKNIEEDLKRRDFTINALALDLRGNIIDLFEGKKDINDSIVRTVGEPDDRFGEDALRMLRAIRFSAELGFGISYETLVAITKHKESLKKISQERIRDEIIKIINSPDPMLGIGLLEKTGLLEYILPELREGLGCEQKGEHIYDVFEHMLHALGHAADKKFPFEIRLAALFHDIGKPRTRRWDGTKAGGKGKYTFYGHEVVGARMTEKILTRLRFPKETIELVTKFVRYHMFFSDTEQITLSAVRRTIVNVGREHIWELMQVRECDRVGMKKKEAPYRLRKYFAMIEEALRAPTSVGMLKIDGNYMIKDMKMKPGPRMGWILHALLEEYLEDPSTDSANSGQVTKNDLEYLENRVRELDKLSDEELKILGEKGKQVKDETEEEEIIKLHKKHGVTK